MRVCLLPTDLWGVGSYRVLFPGAQVEKRGHEVFLHVDARALARWDPRGGNQPIVHAFDFDLWNRPTRTFDADVYVFQRRMEWAAVDAIRKLKSWGKRVVVELDDNYDAIPVESPGMTALLKHPDRLRIDWLNDTVGLADVVTVSTPALADWYSRYNDNVQVLPNRLDWDMWRDVVPQCEVERPRVRIGWMGWLEWRNGDLDQLREWLPDFLREHPNVDFVSVGERRGNAKALRKAGHVTVHDYLGVPVGQRVTVKARPFRELAQIVPSFDIGLVPLVRNDFNESKSCLKGLEYAACGIPCVATPTEQYRSFVREGEDGFLADSAEQWFGAVESLVCDDDARRAMGRAAREKASSLTVQKDWRLWEKAWSGSTLGAARIVSPDGLTLTTA